MSTLELPQPNRWIPEIRAYVPGWYEPHADTSVTVTSGGKPVGRGFRISQVLPTRRWAIGHDGCVMAQRDFEDKYLVYLQGYPIGRSHDVRNDPIPSVGHYVSQTWNEQTGWHEIGFDPYTQAAAKPESKWNQAGELSEHYLRERDSAATEASRLKVLSEQLASGEITAEQFIQRSGLKVVEIGKDEPAVEAVKPTPALEAARCGKTVKAGYVANHERRCKACAALVESSAA
jgi:hypothetical protein